MTANQKAQLQEKREHFKRLSEEKREQLHKLHDDLESSDNREELERIMEAYVEWALVALSASERAHLNRIPDAEERVQQVIKYKGFAEWRRRHFSGLGGFAGRPFGGRQFWRESPTPLSPKYLAAVDRYVLRHADELVSLLPAEKQEAWKAAWKRPVRNKGRRTNVSGRCLFCGIWRGPPRTCRSGTRMLPTSKNSSPRTFGRPSTNSPPKTRSADLATVCVRFSTNTSPAEILR